MQDITYTIDELAAVSAVPSRTIRFYQSRGLLKAPRMSGRSAVYTHLHLERLQRIARMQDRGLRIETIRTLMDSLDRGGVDVAEWLGLEEVMRKPWTEDRARTISEAELYELAGSRRPGLVAELMRVRLIERHGDVFLLESPALLDAALKLEAAGVDLATSLAAWGLIQKHMAMLSKELVALFMRRAERQERTSQDPESTFSALRPGALSAVRVVFGREMEAALRKLVESGRLRTPAARALRSLPELVAE